MIAIELNRLAMLQPKQGDVFVNEDCQKFIVTVSTNKAIFADLYEGKKKASFFGFTGSLSTPPQEDQ